MHIYFTGFSITSLKIIEFRTLPCIRVSEQQQHYMLMCDKLTAKPVTCSYSFIFPAWSGFICLLRGTSRCKTIWRSSDWLPLSYAESFLSWWEWSPLEWLHPLYAMTFSHKISNQLESYRRFWINVLFITTITAMEKSFRRRTVFNPYSAVPESCRIDAMHHWSYSGGPKPYCTLNLSPVCRVEHNGTEIFPQCTMKNKITFESYVRKSDWKQQYM